MTPYNRLNPLHWLLALFSNSCKNTYLHEGTLYWLLAIFSNSRKNKYLIEGTLHVKDSKYKATQRILYWFRNPWHDFSHYIVGFQDDPEFYTMWESKYFAIRRYKWLLLPWFSYYSKYFVFYAGWSDGGKLGFKLRKTPK